MNDRNEFKQVTGYTIEAVTQGDVMDLKRQASIEWLSEIIEFENLQRDQAEVTEDLADGIRIDRREILRIWSRAESNIKGRVQSWASHQSTLHTEGYHFTEDITRMMDGRLMHDLIERMRSYAFHTIDKDSGAVFREMDSILPDEREENTLTAQERADFECLLGIAKGFTRRLAEVREIIPGESVPNAVCRLAALIDG
jgi:hypothetical protein